MTINAPAAGTATATGALFTQRLDTFDAKFADLFAASTGDATDAQVTEASRAAASAYQAMLATPAPTERAIIRKLDALHRYSKGSEYEGDEIAAILADAARIYAVDRTAWDAAFVTFTTAKDADDAISAAYDAATPTEQKRLLDEYERLGAIRSKAQWAVFAIPAPDKAALYWKAETLFGESVDSQDEAPAWRADIIAAYMADVRRLLSGEGR